MRYSLHFPRQHGLDVSRALHVFSHGDGIQRLQQCGRGKLAQFGLFVRHGSDQKNSPQPTRARGKACGLRQGGKHSFGPQVVAKHLGGFLDAQHAVQAIRLGPQCAKRYALDLELPCVWRVLAPTGYRALACAKHRGQLDLRSRKFDCFLPCHAPHYIGKAVLDARLNFLIEL